MDRSRGRGRRAGTFVTGEDRAVTSPLGIALIIGMTMSAALIIVVVGGVALEGSQEDSRIGQAEQAMTQFDSRASQVALGDSGSQTVRIGQHGGNYRIDESAGHVKLVHTYWNGTDNETIYEADLGALIYESGDTSIAYQGGGVWRADGDSSRMISPPEFHYREATLTFPMVLVRGDGTATGRASARIERQRTARAIYPNDSNSYDGGSDPPYENPIDEGNMTVEIQSEFCEGWRSYLAERTEGEVSECDADGTLRAKLITLGHQGDIEVTSGNTIRVRGMEDGATMENFRITLRDQSDEESQFNKLGWSMWAEDGSQEFELSVQGSAVDCGDPVTVTAYYSDNGGDDYESWVNNENYTVECAGDNTQVTIDFLSESHNATMQSISNSDLEHFKTGDYNTTADLFGDPYSDGDEATMNKTVQHYFNELSSDVDFEMEEQNNANLGDDSAGVLEYDGSGEVVTFLHVTENTVEIRLTA